MSDDRIREALKGAFERSHQPPAPGFADRLRSLRLDDGARQWRFRLAAVVALVLAGALIGGLLLSRLSLPSQPAGAPPRATPIAPTSAPLTSPSPTATPTPFWGTLQMVDARHGWLFAPTKAYRTTDAGTHWTDAGAIPGTGTEDRLIAVWGTDIAWLLLPTGQGGSNVYRTTDGGANWQRIGSVGGLIDLPRDLTFVDSQHGWVLASHGSGASGSLPVVLFGTSDGGRTWLELAASPPLFQAAGPGQLPSSCSPPVVTFVDSLHGWSTRYCRQGTMPFFYRTTDGGRTWYPQQLAGIQPHQEVTASAVVFLNRSVGAFTVNQSGGTVTVYMTSDGGATWNMAAQAPGSGDSPLILMSPQQLVLVSGPDQFTLITSGRPTTVQADFGPQGVRQLWFGDALHGLVITGDGRFLRTDDGGHTWLPVNVEQ